MPDTPMSINAINYGADPTGAKDSTAAIQRAVDAVAARGGGSVELPRGIYRVSYDSQGGCLCSSDLTEYIKPGQTIALQATFTGVPAEAKNVTISIPNGGTFSNVAVAR